MINFDLVTNYVIHTPEYTSNKCNECETNNIDYDNICNVCYQFDESLICADCLSKHNITLNHCKECSGPICPQHTFNIFAPVAVFCLHVKAFKGQQSCVERYTKKKF